MRKIIIILFVYCTCIPVLSQNPIDLDTIVNGLNWEDCIESDVILAFKENVIKCEKEEVWNDGTVSSFKLKNVRIGASIADANIIVSKYNRKLVKIGGMMIGSNLDWGKGPEEIARELESLFSKFWGVEHKKSTEYDTDFNDEKKVYTNIVCEWGSTNLNNKSSKGSFFLMHRAKIVVIAIEPK